MPVIVTREPRSIQEIVNDLAKQTDGIEPNRKFRDTFAVRDPEGIFHFGWTDPDRVDMVYDRGGELVPHTEGTIDNMERYKLTNRSEKDGQWIKKRGLLLFRIKKTIHRAEIVSDSLALFQGLGYLVTKFNKEAEIENARDHGGVVGAGLQRVPRTKNQLGVKGVDQTKMRQTRDMMLEAEASGGTLDDVLAANDMTREEIEQ